jgi:hypothetical protein
LLLKFVIFPVGRVGVSKKTWCSQRVALQALHFLKWLLLFLICIPWYPAAITGKKNPLRSLCMVWTSAMGFTYHIKTLTENHSTKEHATLCKVASMWRYHVHMEAIYHV